MFFTLLRKSNLMPDSAAAFDVKKQFIRSDFVDNGDGSMVVKIKYSKTNQFNRRSYENKLLD